MKAAALLLAALLLAPRAVDAGPAAPEGSGPAPLRVLASFLPIYVFAANVGGGVPGVEVDLLLPAALGCPHDYALTPSDLRRIAAADLFLANGLGMETFLGATLRNANPRLTVVETAAGIPALPGPGALGGRGAPNPHTWVSPRNAVIQVRRIEKALAAARPARAADFRRNADAYAARLEALSGELERAARAFARRRIVTHHDVFDYLARDLGLEVVGRITAEGEEPSAAGIARLVRTIRATGAAAVIAEPQYPERLAGAVAAEAGVPLRVLDPVATGEPVPSAYEEAMRRNLSILSEVLSRR